MYLKMEFYIDIISLLNFLNMRVHTHSRAHAQRNEEHFCSNVQFAVLLSSQAFVKKQFFFRVVEEILAEFRVRMRLQLMCFGDPKNQQAVTVPGM
jgi:hypothetical protein